MKKFEKKYIKLGKAYIEDGVIEVVIEEQSHKCGEFGDTSRGMWSSFRASNGVELCSDGSPEVYDDTICMQGRGSVNRQPLQFDSLDRYNKFVEAVNEYNKHFSKPQIKEMTMKEICKELGYEVKIKKGLN